MPTVRKPAVPVSVWNRRFSGGFLRFRLGFTVFHGSGSEPSGTGPRFKIWRFRFKKKVTVTVPRLTARTENLGHLYPQLGSISSTRYSSVPKNGSNSESERKWILQIRASQPGSLRGRATGRRRRRRLLLQTSAYRCRHYSGSGIDSDPLLKVWILREYRRESERFGQK